MVFGKQSSEPTDEQLACQAQAGCIASFEVLVRRFQCRLLHYLRYRCASDEQAEDVLQDTFLQAYAALHTYNSNWRVSTWLFTIARRLAGRASGRQPSTAPLVDEPIAPDADNPFAIVLRQESKQSIWEQVRRSCTEEEFTACWMFYVEGHTMEQIAKALQKSCGATKMLMSRLRRKLHARLSTSQELNRSGRAA